MAAKTYISDTKSAESPRTHFFSLFFFSFFFLLDFHIKKMMLKFHFDIFKRNMICAREKDPPPYWKTDPRLKNLYMRSGVIFFVFFFFCYLILKISTKQFGYKHFENLLKIDLKVKFWPKGQILTVGRTKKIFFFRSHLAYNESKKKCFDHFLL